MQLPTSYATVLPNERAEIERVMRQLEEFGQSHQLPAKVHNAILLAIDEVLSNIMAHGFEESEKGVISINVSLTGEAVHLQIEDNGRAFDPFSKIGKMEVDTKSPIEERPVGGLGWHLVTSLMDEYEYRFKDGKNQLLLKKNYIKLPDGDHSKSNK